MDNQRAELFKQLTVSVEKLPASTAQQAQISSYAANRARLLLGCYRTGDANDPETYVAAIAATLARYSEEIITAVTHPVTGLPSKKSWLPTVKEVFDACEEIDEFERHQVARERLIKEQLAAREQEELARPSRPTMDQLKEKYGENWGLTPRGNPTKPPAPAPSWKEIAAIYIAEPARVHRLMNSPDAAPPSHEAAAE